MNARNIPTSIASPIGNDNETNMVMVQFGDDNYNDNEALEIVNNADFEGRVTSLMKENEDSFSTILSVEDMERTISSEL